MRLFIALPLNKKAKDKVSKELDKVRLPLRGKNIRYMPPKNWHFTLVFLGDQDESDLEKIKRGLSEATKDISPTEVSMKKIMYGPPNRDPRMIWLTTNENTSKNLGEVKNIIRKSLKDQGVNWDKDNRPYKGHITTARFKYNEVKPLPEIEERVNFSYKPEEIDLMKSELTPHGAKYEKIKSYSIN